MSGDEQLQRSEDSLAEINAAGSDEEDSNYSDEEDPTPESRSNNSSILSETSDLEDSNPAEKVNSAIFNENSGLNSESSSIYEFTSPEKAGANEKMQCERTSLDNSFVDPEISVNSKPEALWQTGSDPDQNESDKDSYSHRNRKSLIEVQESKDLQTDLSLMSKNVPLDEASDISDCLEGDTSAGNILLPKNIGLKTSSTINPTDNVVESQQKLALQDEESPQNKLDTDSEASEYEVLDEKELEPTRISLDDGNTDEPTKETVSCKKSQDENLLSEQSISTVETQKESQNSEKEKESTQTELEIESTQIAAESSNDIQVEAFHGTAEAHLKQPLEKDNLGNAENLEQRVLGEELSEEKQATDNQERKDEAKPTFEMDPVENANETGELQEFIVTEESDKGRALRNDDADDETLEKSENLFGDENVETKATHDIDTSEALKVLSEPSHNNSNDIVSEDVVATAELQNEAERDVDTSDASTVTASLVDNQEPLAASSDEHENFEEKSQHVTSKAPATAVDSSVTQDDLSANVSLHQDNSVNKVQKGLSVEQQGDGMESEDLRKKQLSATGKINDISCESKSEEIQLSDKSDPMEGQKSTPSGNLEPISSETSHKTLEEKKVVVEDAKADEVLSKLSVDNKTDDTDDGSSMSTTKDLPSELSQVDVGMATEDTSDNKAVETEVGGNRGEKMETEKTDDGTANQLLTPNHEPIETETQNEEVKQEPSNDHEEKVIQEEDSQEDEALKKEVSSIPEVDPNTCELYVSMASGVRGTMSRFNRATTISQSYNIKFIPVEITMDEKAKRRWKYKGVDRGKTLPAVFRDGDLKCDYNELIEANEIEDVEDLIFDGL